MQAGRNQGLQEVECCARPNHRFQPTSFPPRLRRAGEAAAEPRRWASLVRLHKSITAPLPRHNDNTIGQTMETSIGTGSRACYRLPRTDPVQSSPSLSKRSMTDPGVSPCVQAWARLGGQTTDTCSCSPDPSAATVGVPPRGCRRPAARYSACRRGGVVRAPPRAGYGCRPGSAHCRPVRERRTRGTTTASGRCIGGRRGGHNVPSGDASRPGTAAVPRLSTAWTARPGQPSKMGA